MARQEVQERNSPLSPQDESESDTSVISDDSQALNTESTTKPAAQKRQHHSEETVSGSPTPSSSNEKTRPPKRRRAAARPRKPQSNGVVPWNWQRKGISSDRMGRLNFKGGAVIENGLAIILADKSVLRSGNYVYVMAEPVGEPYYVGRIMEFVPIDEPSKPDSDNPGDLYQVRLNWLYRPADLHKTAKNTRELLLTMHADLCPLASLRGKCTVKHREEIGNAAEFDAYMQTPNNFWFDRLWDRYIERFFDVVPSDKLEILPLQIRETLRAHYQYVILEPAKTKELKNGLSKTCKTCGEWSTDEDSVNCARCDSTYHMACLDPPLVHRPPRGFGWSCAACAQAVEERFHDRQVVGSRTVTPPKESVPSSPPTESDDSLGHDTAPVPTYLKLAQAVASYTAKTETHLREEYLWPFRYLGIHANLEDAFDADDRIHPRAASRIGPKHQAVVKPWPGRPVVYYQSQVVEGRVRGGRRANKKLAKKDITPPGLDMNLPWVQEMPRGYLERGSDTTSTLMWANDVGDPEMFLTKTKVYAEKLSLHPTSPNFFDACLKAFHDSGGDEARALRIVAEFTRKSLKEPTFSDEEIERFEEAVEQHGSELREVYKHVGTQQSQDIVRFYYMWKKTPNGHQIWDNCQARLSRRKTSKSNTDFTASIADTNDPEITFSSNKIKKLQKTVECKHCRTHSSRKWKRASGRLPTESDDPIEALCMRCARLWYRYGVVWQHPEEVLEQYTAKGAGKQKIEPELVEDARSIRDQRLKVESETESKSNTVKKNQDESDSGISSDDEESADEVNEAAASESSSSEEEEEEEEEEYDDHVDDKIQNSYCAICCQRDPYMASVQCVDCKVIIHRACYDVSSDTKASKWRCDPCVNCHSPQSSLSNQCSLCPCTSTSYIQWIQGQGAGNPDLLKFAEYGRWAHLRCAVWNPKVKLAEYEKRQIAVGVLDAVATESPNPCEICKNSFAADNACDTCSKVVHAGCAGTNGFAMGFVLIPDEAEPEVEFQGKKGRLEARIRCPEHDCEELIPMSEVDEESGESVLQLYIKTYLQTEVYSCPSRRAEIVHAQRQHTPSQDQLVLDKDGENQVVPRPLLPSNFTCSTCRTAGALFWYNVTPPDKAGAVQLQCPRCFSGGSILPNPLTTPLVPSINSSQVDQIIRSLVR